MALRTACDDLHGEASLLDGEVGALRLRCWRRVRIMVAGARAQALPTEAAVKHALQGAAVRNGDELQLRGCAPARAVLECDGACGMRWGEVGRSTVVTLCVASVPSAAVAAMRAAALHPYGELRHIMAARLAPAAARRTPEAVAVLLEGVAGAGKASLVRAVAADVEAGRGCALPVVSASAYPRRSLSWLAAKAQQVAPCVLLLENLEGEGGDEDGDSATTPALTRQVLRALQPLRVRPTIAPLPSCA